MLSQGPASAHPGHRCGVKPRFGLAGAICALGLFTAACATHTPAAATPAAPAAVAVTTPSTAPAPPPQSDPVVELIAASTRLFDAGQKELQDGHLEQAKTQFNRSVEVLLE